MILFLGSCLIQKKLNSLDDNKLKECCINLGNALKHDSSLNVDSNDLLSELKVL